MIFFEASFEYRQSRFLSMLLIIGINIAPYRFQNSFPNIIYWTWPQLGDRWYTYFHPSFYKGEKLRALKVTFSKSHRGTRTKHYLLTPAALLSYYIIHSMLKYNQEGLFPGTLSGETFPSPKLLCPCLICAEDNILPRFPFLADVWYQQYGEGWRCQPREEKAQRHF